MATNTVEVVGNGKTKKKKKHHPVRNFFIILLIILLLPIILVGVLLILLYDRSSPTTTYDNVNIDKTTIVEGMLSHSMDNTADNGTISISLEEEFFNKLLSMLLKDKIKIPLDGVTANIWMTIDGTNYDFHVSLAHPIYATKVTLHTKLEYLTSKEFEGLLFTIADASIGKLNNVLSLAARFIPSNVEDTINNALAGTGLNLKFDLANRQIRYAIEDMRNNIVSLIGENELYSTLLEAMMNYIDVETDGKVGVSFDLKNFVSNDLFFKKCDNPFLNLTKEQLTFKLDKVCALANEGKITKDHIDEITQFYLVGYDNLPSESKTVFDTNYKDKFKNEYHIVKAYKGDSEEVTATTYDESLYGKVYVASTTDLQTILSTKLKGITNFVETMQSKAKASQAELIAYLQENEVLTIEPTKTQIEQFVQDEMAKGGTMEEIKARIADDVSKAIKLEVDADKLKEEVLPKSSINISNKDMSKLFASTNTIGTGYTISSNDKETDGENNYHISSVFINDIHSENAHIEDSVNKDYFSIVAGLNINGYQTQMGLISACPNNGKETNKLSLKFNDESDDKLGIYFGNEKAPDSLFQLFKDLILSTGELTTTSNAENNIFKFTDKEFILDISSIIPNTQTTYTVSENKIALYSWEGSDNNIEIEFTDEATKPYLTINQINTTISLYHDNDGGGVSVDIPKDFSLIDNNLEQMVKDKQYKINVNYNI